MDGRFEREMAAYAAKLPELLLAHEGSHAVFLGDNLLGIEKTYEAALEVGYEASPDGGFLVMRIQRSPATATFTRNLAVA